MAVHQTNINEAIQEPTKQLFVASLTKILKEQADELAKEVMKNVEVKVIFKPIKGTLDYTTTSIVSLRKK